MQLQPIMDKQIESKLSYLKGGNSLPNSFQLSLADSNFNSFVVRIAQLSIILQLPIVLYSNYSFNITHVLY